MSRTSSLLPVALLLAGCVNQDEKDTTDTGVEDTGQKVYDEGCITVDGEGGYAWLNDAIEVASEGSVIQVCAGSFEETVVVSKPITILGSDEGTTYLQGETNKAAFQVEAVSGVTISGFHITSTRSGVEVEKNASQLVLADLVLEAIPNYGIDLDTVDGATVSGCLFEENAWGAVRVKGGAAVIEGSTFTDNIAFAVKAEGGADVEVTGCEATGTMYSDTTSDGVSDGFAIHADGAARLALSNNHLANPILQVFATSTPQVSLDGDTLEGGWFGVYQVYGDLSLVDTTITDPTEFGILYVAPSGETLHASGLTVSGDPDVVSDYAAEEGVVGSVGIYAEANDITLHDTKIEGWNSFGAYLVSYDGAGGVALLDGVTVEGTGRRGVLAAYLDVEAVDTHISGIRDLEEDDGMLYVDLPAGMAIEYGTLSWTGGSVTDCDGWGIASVVASTVVDGAEFSGNTRSALMDYQGSSSVTGSTFSATASPYGTLWAYESTGMAITGSWFTDNRGQVISDYSDWVGYPYWVVSYDQGQDITATTSRVEIAGNTFSGGDDGIYLGEESTGIISGNTWKDYLGSITRVSNSSATISDETVDGWGGYLLYSYHGQVEVSRLTATRGEETLQDVEYWENEELTSSYTSSSYGQGFYLNSSEAYITDTSLSEVVSNGIYSSNSTVEAIDVTMDRLCQSVTWYQPVYMSWSSVPVEAWLVDVSVTSPGHSPAVYLSASSSSTLAGLEAEGLVIEDSPGDGLYTYRLPGGTFTGLSISGSDADAVNSYQSTAEYISPVLSANAGNGMDASGSDLIITGATVDGNGLAGIVFSGDSLELTDSIITMNGTTGLDVSASTLVAVDNVITMNGEYGMSCTESVSVVRCGNGVTDNVVGDNMGCPESCVIE